jgi:DnaJ-class molecular chaperone
MLNLHEEIDKALETLALPRLISRAEVKKQYHFLAKKHHPDVGGNDMRMETLNYAYTLLTTYIDEFRYSFDDEEISKQYPGANYAKQFRP